MKKCFLLLVIILIFVITSCSIRKDFIACENFITKDYTLSNASKIEIKNIYLKQGTTYFGANVYFCESSVNKISITASEDVIEEIDVSNYNSKISITADRYKNYQTKSVDIYIYGFKFDEFTLSNVDAKIKKSTFMDKNIKINLSGASNLSMDEINNNAYLDVSGSSIVNIRSINIEELDINSSGSSSIEVSDVILNRVNASLSGSSKLYLKGNINKGHYEGSGASKFELEKCLNNDVDISLSGASKLNVSFKNSIKGDISGGSYVLYYSESDDINVKVSGGSKIIRG